MLEKLLAMQFGKQPLLFTIERLGWMSPLLGADMEAAVPMA